MIASAVNRNRALARGLAVATLAAVFMSGCTASSSQPVVITPSGPDSPAVAPGGGTTTQASTGSATPLRNVSVALVPVWRGLSRPLFVTSARDGSKRVFIVEKTGRIRVVRNGRLGTRPYLDLSRKISDGGEQGLLGLAFAPGFARSGRFYVNYTDLNGNTNIVRYQVSTPSADVPRIVRAQTVLRVTQPYSNHNGGCIAFGRDGYLYIGTGDGGSGGDPQNRAQNPKVLLGKMLRIDVGESLQSAAPNTLTVPKTYRIPRDNPFTAAAYSSKGYRPEIWALGLRNPWRFSFDRSTGDLWIGDVGQNAWEEIDRARSGRGGQNYGWHKYEGTHAYPPGSKAPSKSGLTFPVVEYPHPTGESVTGGYVYRGARQPLLRGVYLYADYVKGKVWGLRLSGSAPENALLADTSYDISSFGEDEAGELYACDISGGTVYRVTAKSR